MIDVDKRYHHNIDQNPGSSSKDRHISINNHDRDTKESIENKLESHEEILEQGSYSDSEFEEEQVEETEGSIAEEIEASDNSQ